MIKKFLKLIPIFIIIFFLKDIEDFTYDFRLYISSFIENKDTNEFVIIEYPYNYIGNNIALSNKIDDLSSAKAIILDSTLIEYDDFINLLKKLNLKKNIFLTKEYIYKNDNLYLFSNNYFDIISGVSNYRNTVREYKKASFNTLENKLEPSIEFLIYQSFFNNKIDMPDIFKIKYIFGPNQIKKVQVNTVDYYDTDVFKNKIVFLSYTNNYVYFPFTEQKFLESELFINNLVSLDKKIYINEINNYFEIFLILVSAIYGYIKRKSLKKLVAISILFVLINIALFMFFNLYINIVYIVFSLLFFRLFIFDNISNIINRFNFKERIKSKNRELTILFCDIENFTLITEKLSNNKLLEILNDFLKLMTEIIINNNGNLDKYLGDGFMSFFDNTDDSIKATIEMYKKFEVFQKKWVELGIKPFQIRIGISTGNVLLANIGYKNKMKATIIGNSVNLASRLEKLNKEYNTSILICKKTNDKISNKYNTKYLGKVEIRGRSEKEDIYELRI